MPRYVIIGAGAVGASLAAQLHEAQLDYVLVARERQVAALRDPGLRYIRPSGTSTIRLEVTTAEQLTDLRHGDVLVFTPKLQDLDAALIEWAWRPLVSGGLAADLPALTLQNGLAAERKALRRFGTVLGVSVNLPGQYVEPGVVEIRSAPAPAVITIGRFPTGTDELTQQVAQDWRRARYAVQVTDDIGRWKAAKLLWNINNAVDVLTGNDDEVSALKAGLVAETRAVLAAAGIDIADTSTERTIDTSGFVVMPRPPGQPGGMSTWQSFARADATGHEVDYLNGEVVLLGRLHGVATPLNEAIQRLLGASFREGEPPGTQRIAQVLSAAGVSA